MITDGQMAQFILIMPSAGYLRLKCPRSGHASKRVVPNGSEVGLFQDVQCPHKARQQRRPLRHSSFDDEQNLSWV